MRDHMDRTFSRLPRTRSWNSRPELDPSLPRECFTDDKRLQQIIKTCFQTLSSSTERGSVKLRFARACPVGRRAMIA